MTFKVEVVAANIQRLTNQIWKLIPMRENEEDWQKQLKTVIVELAGLEDIVFDSPSSLQLLAKLRGLEKEETDFSFYRKTVFESISLIQGIKKEIENE